MVSTKWISAGALALACIASLGARAEDRPHRQPPPEAYTACSAKKANDACSVQLRDRAVEGTCKADAQEQLFCRPLHPPHRGPPPEAFAACESKKAGDACTAQTPDGEKAGVCREGREGGVFCAPPHMQHGEPPPPPQE